MRLRLVSSSHWCHSVRENMYSLISLIWKIRIRCVGASLDLLVRVIAHLVHLCLNLGINFWLISDFDFDEAKQRSMLFDIILVLFTLLKIANDFILLWRSLSGELRFLVKAYLASKSHTMTFLLDQSHPVQIIVTLSAWVLLRRQVIAIKVIILTHSIVWVSWKT